MGGGWGFWCGVATRDNRASLPLPLALARALSRAHLPSLSLAMSGVALEREKGQCTRQAAEKATMDDLSGALNNYAVCWHKKALRAHAKCPRVQA